MNGGEIMNKKLVEYEPIELPSESPYRIIPMEQYNKWKSEAEKIVFKGEIVFKGSGNA